MFCPYAPVWGDIATWLTGLATWLTGVVTAATLAFGVYQWFKLRSDSIAAKDAAAQEERRAQARRVSAWFDGSDPSLVGFVRVSNTSDEPVSCVVVYEVYMDGGDRPGSGEESERDIQDTLRSIKDMEGRGYLPPNTAENALTPPAKQSRAILQTLPPGTYPLKLFIGRDNAGLEIAFTDSAGRHWVRRATGELIERDKNALNHYRIPAPVDYSFLLSGGAV
ncbi:hypothetical protein PDG61_19190 [Mycolicibacterium sp. BiH015]|uniref:hypothetical protein n=1 Tax=Mycolicibacterium sp. BiH015 TaxID=3018808 RepID=UPI0022DFE750|nr:hypothetical protein [Mycolicibacterium sp. BiH015]MDA2893055.1 hypothetical protein [Mycolicibacterium sp. BiH015]